jgi:transcription elongation factor GreA-like protein/transcription elongation GreA/GreB family factor
MREEFEKLVRTGKIQQKHVDQLVSLMECGFCAHKSWGFGRITAVDVVFSRFTIDFIGKEGHTMDLGFSADSLQPITKDHILARKLSDLENLRQTAALHHLDLIKVVLKSYDGKATLDQIQKILVPDVIAEDWKKWWEVARREMKKDGHFLIPTKKTDPIVYQSEETSLQDRLLTDFRAGKGLKAKVAVTFEALKSLEDLTDRDALANEMVATLNAEIATHQRTQPAVALEAIFVRDDLRTACNLPPIEGEVDSASLWQAELRLGSLLEDIAASKHRRALQSFKDSTPLWHEALLGVVNSVGTKLAGEIAHTLISGGKLDALKETLARLISQHSVSSDLLLWLCKDRSDSFADILGPEVFRAALTAMERDQFMEKRSNRLRDYILDDQELIVDLIGSADLEIIKDMTRALQLSPVFDDMDKRSLLGRIVKSYPAIQSIISGGEATRQEATHQVSWDSLERRKNEYTELVQKTIPANSKEIAIARSYGDLRENHEYKAAKEMQKVLMRRKTELEVDLGKARGTDFANAKTDVVGLGTRVRVTDLGNNTSETYDILGAWDGDPDKNILSYLTPLGQCLMNQAVGEVAEFEFEGSKKKLRVDEIVQSPVVAPKAETE